MYVCMYAQMDNKLNKTMIDRHSYMLSIYIHHQLFSPQFLSFLGAIIWFAHKT
jgi:hypothetical protein